MVEQGKVVITALRGASRGGPVGGRVAGHQRVQMARLTPRRGPCPVPAGYTGRLFNVCVGLAVWYVIEGFDGADVLAARLQARSAHLARLQALADAGRLLLAGPCPAIDGEDPGPAGFSGSVVIAQFDALEQAQAWAEADPYVAAGVYQRVLVRPFKKVLP